MPILSLVIYTLFLFTNGQKAGNVKRNDNLPLPINHMGSTIQTFAVIDGNWRWIHNNGGYENCYTSNWDPKFCPDPVSCAKNCVIEGVSIQDYKDIYGVSTSGNALTLNYVTGSNVGSRVYILDSDGKKYRAFNLKNRQIEITADMSQVPCGLNGAIYLVEMPLDGGLNQAGPAYGVGYGDAQCPADIKYINGFVNTNLTGACSIEMDLWEANGYATAVTPHSCSTKGVQPCTNDIDCGTGNYRYKGVCDKDGADYNPYREGLLKFYGPGSDFTVDSSKPFSFVTQFITSDNTDNGELIGIKRFYRQNGKIIDSIYMDDEWVRQRKIKFKESNDFARLGGMRNIGQSFERGMVLVLSLWDDTSVNMLWLDSQFPTNSNEPGAKRGPCDPNRPNAWGLRSRYPNSKVVYSDIKVAKIENNPNPPTPSPPTPSPPTPQDIIFDLGNNVGLKCEQCIINT